MGTPNLLEAIGPGVYTYRIANLGSGKSDSPVSSQVLSLPCSYLVNVDIHNPYIDFLKVQRFDALVVAFTISEIELWLETQLDRDFDILLLIDVLEHFPPLIARLVLDKCKRVTSRKIIIFLPLGECKQDEYDGNRWQKHWSTWTASDLEALGFKVEVLKAFHLHFNPPVDAGVAIYEVGK